MYNNVSYIKYVMYALCMRYAYISTCRCVAIVTRIQHVPG